ncbi:MAG: hypothetical protein J3K34DRAFT_525075 [Monoraphidium minutum]|nr:MAG: hypothetical protein J3K34DRAFT_525075 [Monoraphidium minutum]
MLARPCAHAGVAAVIAAGVGNRVLYRLALVPMRDHVFALAQLQNLGYIGIYSSLLALRYRQGKVTREMLAVPKGSFLLIGACEALAQLLLMAGAAHLPGALLPLLMQTSLLWQVAFSAALLGTRPTAAQLAGVLLVAGGVALASLPPSALGAAGGAPLVGPGDAKHVALCVASFAFPSLAVIVKERIFREARRTLGRDLDVLVVNAFGSAAQAVFVLALMPLITAARGLPLSALPAALAAGGRALAGLPPAAGGPPPPGAPLFPAAYVLVNVAFNISALLLVRSAGAVPASLTMACLVPLSVLAFSLPLPLLPPAALGPGFWGGSALLMAGLAAYNWGSLKGGGGGAKGE